MYVCVLLQASEGRGYHIIEPCRADGLRGST